MDLTNYVPTPISDASASFAAAKYDPTRLVKAQLETVDAITAGQALLMDATSPFVLQAEMAAALSANAVLESIVQVRRQYPALALTEDELYLHMSDADYLNRFASPASGKLRFTFLVSDLINNAPFDSTENAFKLIIPRDTSIVVDTVSFMTLYPIVIRYYQNGVLQVTYDPTISSPLMTLKNTVIPYGARSTASQEKWVSFDIDALQVLGRSEHVAVNKSYSFSRTFPLTDDFYTARVFYRNSATQNLWKEIRTTHTDQVFDVTVPTAVLKVVDSNLTVSIPTVYNTTGLLSGELRMDIYTTRGEMSMNLSNYPQRSFVVTPDAYDADRDLNDYTQALANISYYVYSLDLVVGGKAALTFTELRDRVIYNALGPQNLPITNVQADTTGQNAGFEIVKNVDTLTNRIFLATKRMPTPSQQKLITAANIGIITYATDGSDLLNHPKVIDNGNRVTLRSKAVWLNNNGQLSLVPQVALDALKSMTQTAMVTTINAEQFYYTPFYYVLDSTGEEYDMRAYALDQPYGKDQNFVSQNETLNLLVNTASYMLTKVDAGYQLRIVTRSGDNYKSLQDAQVGVQLAFHPKGDNAYAYINGVMESKSAGGERIYRFDINTNHDFDTNDLICITNGQVKGIPGYQAWINLETTFEILHWTSSITTNYVPDGSDKLLGKFLLPQAAAGNTREQLVLHLGDALSNLWRRAHSYYIDTVYETHMVDVPLLYDEDVYGKDPVTGSIFTMVNGTMQYIYLHRKGDPVLDVNGEPVMKYKAGDPMLDAAGNPIVNQISSVRRELDLLIVDAKYLFSDDVATVQYRDEIDAVLTTWITENVLDLQSEVLEQTQIFFYPKTTLGTIRVLVENNGEDNLSAEQSFTLDLYVPYAIYNDVDIRDKLRTKTIQILDTAIGQTTININQIADQLKAVYGETVRAFKLSGLGGALDYQVVQVVSGRHRLCLKKELVIQADKSMIVEDAVTINWNVVN